MKKNLLYIAGFLMTSCFFSSCDEEAPSYTGIVTDTQELTIDLDQTTEGSFQVLQGNGNYKVVSENEDIATAVAEGNTIKVTAAKAGITNLTITDWARKSANVQVVVDQLSDLLLVNGSTTMYPEESKIMRIYTGNRGYKVEVDNDEVVKATVNEQGEIQLTSLAPGTAKVTVTDRKNKKAELSVKVIKRLVVDNAESILRVIIGEDVTIRIKDGNGGYTCTSGSASYLKCEMSADNTELIIKGVKRYRFNKTVTIKDKEGQTVDIHIEYVDSPYLETEGYNYFLKTTTTSTYQSLGINKVSEVFYSPEVNVSQIIAKSSTTATSGGYAIEFSGNLEVGEKSNAKVYKVTKGVIDRNSVMPATSDCRIDQVKNGWYWISFLQEGCTLRSYMVVKGNN